MSSPRSGVRPRAALLLAVAALLVSIVAGLGTPAGAQTEGGAPDSPSLAPSPPPTVGTSGTHTCAVLPSTSLQCWGLNGDGQATPPAGSYELVGSGFRFTCAIVTGGTLTCWGRNNLGQTSFPAGTYDDLGVGTSHSCAVSATDDSATCWGLDDFGQATAPGGSFETVAAGRFHSCGIETDETLTCWGRDNQGQASPPAGTFDAVAAGENHSCALATDGSIDCWGLNNFGQANDPVGTFTEVTAGRQNSCGLRVDDTITCWGRDNVGQSSPPGGTFDHVNAGGDTGCGITTAALVECWGQNDNGQANLVVTSPPPATGYLGLPYAHQFDLTHISPPPVVGFSAGGPPPGLALDGSGLLTGLPGALGSFPATFAATDAGGLGLGVEQAYSQDIEEFDGLAGIVTGEGSGPPPVGLEGIRVRVWDGGVPVAVTTTGLNGFWSVQGLPAGTYTVSYRSLTDRFFAEWYDDAPTQALATPVVYDGVTGITDLDASLTPASSVSGLIREAGTGTPIDGAKVTVFRTSDGAQVDKAFTGPDGRYTITTIPADTYYVLAEAPGYLGKYWFNSLSMAGATPLDVPVLTDVAGINLNLIPESTIGGTVTEDGSGTPLDGVQVTLRDGNGVVITSTVTAGGGLYTFGGLAGGTYKVEFSSAGYVGEFWNDQASLGAATPIVIGFSTSTTGVDAALVPVI